MKSLSVTQVKATGQCYYVVLFIMLYMAVPTFASVDEIIIIEYSLLSALFYINIQLRFTSCNVTIFLVVLCIMLYKWF